jgi:hypothetical protein
MLFGGGGGGVCVYDREKESCLSPERKCKILSVFMQQIVAFLK